MIKQILSINGLEWFDKANGNTYFSGLVTLTDCATGIEQEIVKINYEYGYNQHIRQKALEHLHKKGMFLDCSSLWQLTDKHNVKIVECHNKTTRQRDLKNY